MDENRKDIEEVFTKIQDYFGNKNDKSYQMFHMLVSVTLKYRDDLESSGQGVITVEETRNALTIFMEVIKTKTFPKDLDGKEKHLVMRWLEALKGLKPN